jgi:alpha-ribazole phosphatase
VTVMGGVWLVRHGATTAPGGMTIGSSDLPLSRDGLAQSHALAAQLAHRPLKRIFASDKVRALATAEIIASGHGLHVEIDQRLRELDFGGWEGRRLAELWAEEPDAAQGWEKDLWATPASFGESLLQLDTRVRDFWVQSCLGCEGEVVVVAHRGSLAVLRALITGASLESAFAGIELGTAMWFINGPPARPAERTPRRAARASRNRSGRA